jgi:hypothetical protein
MKEYVAEVYDDRDDKVISRGKERRDYDTAWDEAKSLMNDFIDPDDGVRPSHFHPRVVEVKR